MNNLLIMTLFGVLLIMFISVDARACSCPDSLDPLTTKIAWWMKGSAAVFSGETIKLERVPGTQEMVATFSVVEFWKGDLSPIVAVRTEILPGMSCGYDFRIGVPYLVYAYQRSDGLATNSCTGSRQRFGTEGKEQVTILGAGKTPEQKSKDSVSLHE